MHMANPFRLIRIMNGIIGVRASTKPSRKVLKGLIIVANIVKKRKIAVAKQKTLQKQASAQEAKAVADQKKTDFDRKQYEDQLETQFVAVECPNCGSSGNKIRRATVGYCPFCGTAIKVDQDGNVSYMDRDNTAT